MSGFTDGRVVVGEFFIAPGAREGRVWIGKEHGRCAGEGGDFDIKELEELIRKFYEEKF